MPACAKCGREIPRRTAVFKVMETGKYADGGSFMRNVSLCPKCAAEAEKAEESKQKQQKLLILVVLLLAIAGAVYYFVIM